MTAPELIGWWRYWQLEPWGDLRADMRQEIARQRAVATIDDDVPSWQYPYRSIDVSEDAGPEETPAEFQKRVFEQHERIMQERRRQGLDG